MERKKTKKKETFDSFRAHLNSTLFSGFMEYDQVIVAELRSRFCEAFLP